MLTVLVFIACVVGGYLIGSLCSAVIVCRMFALPDPCAEGSKNPGATNVLRIAGKRYASIVLIADMLKGFIPVFIASMIGAGVITASFTCLAAVLGHIYPIFFKFKGGKGLATTLGALFGLHFMFGVLALATWLLVANFTRFSSLASIITVLFVPFYSLYFTQGPNAFIPLIIITFVVLYKHRGNINRLMEGVEPKIVLRKPARAEQERKAAAEKKPVETLSDIVAEDTQSEEKNPD